MTAVKETHWLLPSSWFWFFLSGLFGFVGVVSMGLFVNRVVFPVDTRREPSALLLPEEESHAVADAAACFPHVSQRIDDVCHCAVDNGWIRCDAANTIRHEAQE